VAAPSVDVNVQKVLIVVTLVALTWYAWEPIVFVGTYVFNVVADWIVTL